MATKTFLEAIRDAQFEEMARDPSVFVMGEDVESNMFGTFSGMQEEFGGERVRNTPIAEAGMAGVAVGAAMVGMRPIVDFTMSPFLYPAMDQIVSMASKSRYLYGGQAQVPIVLRSNMIYGNGNAAQHSDRPYSMFANMPGLNIMIPSCPYDMKGLMKTAIRNNDPVLSFEDAALWSSKSEIPDEEYLIPFGEATIRRAGDDVTIVAIGAMVGLATQAAEILAQEGIGAEIIDPRTIVPLDKGTILESVRKTGRLVVVDSSFEMCSVSSEVCAIVASEGFWDLRGPLQRVATPNTHIPFSPTMEKQLFPSVDRIIEAARRAVA
jgi:pyruvate dehydrogenase E1 component beta subunit